jgi:predicted  nucleic acid-binding Zn-ribbon protein
MPNEITEEKYRKLKQEVEETKAEADRAQGALDQLLARLKEEFDCDNLKEAKTKLAELKAKKERAESAFEKEMAEYEEKWKG